MFLFIRLSAASLLRTVRSFSSADDKRIISGNGIVPSLRKAKAWSLRPKIAILWFKECNEMLYKFTNGLTHQ
eukprot:11738670-Prorocentrum_lima.AAC.1